MLRQWRSDVLAVLVLVVLWAIFFWRILTPIAADQASFKKGDFSGQFVAFGAYQYARSSDGDIPLWNPYNNGGFPFVADTQAAVFYGPRLVTMVLSQLAGEWTYNALQLEAAFHVLLLSLMMYVYVRLLTIRNHHSVFGSLASAIIMSYGGFTAGYPPLQLALLEAAIWLPLAATGIHLATNNSFRWQWLILAGFALGQSWMAGHPQTSWFLTYTLVAYLGYRVYVHKLPIRNFLIGTVIMGAITFGITAVTLLPGIEYLAHATRNDFGFDAKSNGFPLQDVMQFFFPGSVSYWSPLYVGIPGLVFAAYAIRIRCKDSLFWLVLGIIALLLSFGANSVFYHAVYNVLPGLRYFRGQERAALLVTSSLAILAGSGIAALPAIEYRRWLRNTAFIVASLLSVFTIVIFVAWLGDGAAYGTYIRMAVLSAVIAWCVVGITYSLQSHNASLILMALVALITFELFTVSVDSDTNYESIPATEQLSMSPPDLIQPVVNDTSSLFRVDGFRGLEANYGSLYSVMDIRGISPLFLSSAYELIYSDYINNPLAWELFAVKYVYSERDELHVPTTIITQGSDSQGAVYLHELSDPRPFAMLMNKVDVVDSDVFAYALARDPNYDARHSIILLDDVGLELEEAKPTGTADVTIYEPEHIEVDISADENAILSLAQIDYPGWEATLDDEPIEIRRAYGALMAFEIPAGTHQLELVYNPASYRIGAIISQVTWVLVLLFGIPMLIIASRGQRNGRG
ncbi:MAG: YfhO family protein [Anaerolineae bacterium]|nr:YfhO family protein [Anaerolineae bacterium]